MSCNNLMNLFFVASILSVFTIGADASPFTIDGSTVYVNGGYLGVRTLTPITVLDVNGDAQFGAGATKSTFTATGLLKLTSSGIQWADGSTSTTATSGGGGAGDATLNSTQTFTGANTFVNAVTFSSAVYGTYVEVASAAVSAVTSYTFGSTVVTSSAVFKLEWNGIQNTSNGYPEMQVNGIATGYRHAWRQICDNGDGSTYLSTNYTAAPLTGLSFCAANTSCEGEVIITQTYPTGRIFIRGRTASINTNVCDQSGVGTLSPAAGLNAIKFLTSAGTFTGTLKLYRRWDK